jgi:glyoxylase-like metal-dependent hydrolase (beta-lactamase superfamily II)
MMREIAEGVAVLPIVFVNAYFVGAPDEPWVLVDSGIPQGFARVLKAAEQRYGADQAPQAIILTHGHFDHAGAARQCAEHWNVPIYAHDLEMPYLTNRSDYPPPDPTIGGFLPFLSRFMPSGAVDLGEHLHALPSDGSVPHLPAWRWMDTPGHSPGHISLWRETDATLIAGDALATADFDSTWGAMTKKQQLAYGGSPFNCDWDAARDSVRSLAKLKPFVIACGHGVPMNGPHLAAEFEQWARDFEPPSHGRYVETPARFDENGVVELPPPAPDTLPLKAAAFGALAIAFPLLVNAARRAKSRIER